MSGSGVQLAYKVFSPVKFPKSWLEGYTKTSLENNVEMSEERHPPLILLHGLTNTKETWNDCAQAIANRAGTKVYTLDARNHGDSGWIDKIDYINMADDVACFMDSMGIQTAILIGHSMGGLTAMSFAFRHPHKLHSLIIEDMSLNSPHAIDEWLHDYLIMLREVLDIIPSGKELLEAKRIAARYLVQEPVTDDIYHAPQPDEWSGRDLPLRRSPRDGGGYEWKTNLDVIQDLVQKDEFTPTRLDKNIEGATYDGPVLMIYGTQSPLQVLKDKDVFLKHFPNTVYEPVEGAKHSIHVGFPEAFTELVCDFILKQRHLKSSI